MKNPEESNKEVAYITEMSVDDVWLKSTFLAEKQMPIDKEKIQKTIAKNKSPFQIGSRNLIDNYRNCGRGKPSHQNRNSNYLIQDSCGQSDESSEMVVSWEINSKWCDCPSMPSNIGRSS